MRRLTNFCSNTVVELMDTLRRNIKSGQKRTSIVITCRKQAEPW